MADFDTFELLPREVGSGPSKRVAVHVAVRMYNVPEAFRDWETPPICLTADANSSHELDAFIDELIAELQQLKTVGRRKFVKAA